MIDAYEIRENFSILSELDESGKPYIYLDNAATSLTPNVVVDRIADYYKHLNANIHRSFYKRAIQTEKEVELASIKIANLINADPSEIIYTKNASTASNMLVQLLVQNDIVKSGDTVIVSLEEHHSNFLPWLYLQEKGINVKTVSLNEEYQIDLDQLESILKENKTKFVVTGYVSNVTGAIHSVTDIIRLAHSFEAKCIIDVTQAIPHFKIDVKNLDVDYIFFSGHKILGPTGIGVLFGKKEYLAKIKPYMFGGGMVKNVKHNQVEMADIPHKFEVGTPDIANVLGLGAAAEFIQKIGYENIYEYEEGLKSYLHDKIKKVSHIRTYGPRQLINKIDSLSFPCDVISNEEICFILDKYYNIAIRSGKLCAQPLVDQLNPEGVCRISCYFYNTCDEINTLCSALDKIIKSYL